MSFHLFVSWVSFINDLDFSVYMSFTSLVTFISKYFILFDIIEVNEIVLKSFWIVRCWFIEIQLFECWSFTLQLYWICILVLTVCVWRCMRKRQKEREIFTYFYIKNHAVQTAIIILLLFWFGQCLFSGLIALAMTSSPWWMDVLRMGVFDLFQMPDKNILNI